MTELHYRQWMGHIQRLPVCALVTTGRTGSDFLQSLLDSHPQVLTFNGHFAVYTEFFKTSACFKLKPVSARDLVDEFVGRFIYKLVSRYDVQEGKDRLGDGCNRSFSIDTDMFRAHVVGLLGGLEVTSRDFLLAVYGAYNLCLGHELLAKRIAFHHPHLFYEFEEFVKDFPNTSVVVTTRDPRANFTSHVEHFRRYYENHDNQQHLYVSLKMMLEDSTPLEKTGLRYVAVRLEDLPKESTLKVLSHWLGITYRDSLLRSTWAGLDWHGDSLSGRTFEPQGWSETRSENGWRQRLGRMEQYVFNYILQARLQHYRYPYKKARWWDSLLVPLLIPLPMKYERRYLSFRYYGHLSRKGASEFYKELPLTPLFYFKRVVLCYKHYFRALLGSGFTGPWIDGAKPA